jgi:hypothetical protein
VEVTFWVLNMLKWVLCRRPVLVNGSFSRGAQKRGSGLRSCAADAQSGSPQLRLKQRQLRTMRNSENRERLDLSQIMGCYGSVERILVLL